MKCSSYYYIIFFGALLSLLVQSILTSLALHNDKLHLDINTEDIMNYRM